MGDKYSHSSFTLLQTTELIREVVDHVLRQPVSEVPAELRSDLAIWRDVEEERREQTFHHHDGVEDISSSISFDLVKRAHKQLEKTPLERGPVYLHELLSGSRLILPTLLPLPRNPELVKRLEKIKSQQEQKEYDKMVSNIDNRKQHLEKVTLGLEVQATSKQLWTVFNFLVTVIGSFAFGFCAARAVGYELPGCVFTGLFIAILVFIADLYFLVKSPTLLDSSKKKKADSRKVALKAKQQ